MAVEARHLNHFPPQFIDDRYPNLLIPTNQGGNIASAQQMRFVGIPSATTTLPENPSLCHPITSGNTDSGLTYASRKRSRDDHPVSLLYGYAAPAFPETHKDNVCEDFLPQFQQYQSEIDAIITQNAKKIRSELEERQKQQARLLAAAIGQGAMKKMKEKDEQIERLGKWNLLLQEKMKSLYVENQLLRDLAQTNEATANSLRTNLEQVLLRDRPGAAAEDVESCCGSSDHAKDDEVSNYTDRKCRKCGEWESSVLLLPCRHLCLCSSCGSGCGSHQLQECPVCNCTMTATLHVNMSP